MVEAKIDKSSGVIATLLVQHGTLRTGDIVAVSATFGKIRALINDKGQSVKEATPSTPIEILGLNQAPVAGDEFVVVRDERTAKQLISLRLEQEKNKKICSTKKTSLDQLFMNAKGAGVKYLPVVIKGDVHGSIDAIQASLGKIGNEEIAVKVLHSGVGAITESDVTLASASKAIIVGFNVRANAQARDMVKKNGVNVKYYSIIYNLLDDIKSILGGMLSPVSRESILGYAEVRQVFSVTKIGKIAGCYVTEGIIKRNTNARVLRDDIVMHDGKFSSLKRFKDDVKEVKSGFECGISFENYDDIQEKDRIEVYEILKEQRVL